MKSSHPIVRNLVLALGLAAAGWFIGHGFVRARMANRFVSVKGISEREVRAGLAIWPLKIIIADNDLGRAHGKLATDIREIQGFLTRHGLDATHTELQDFAVTDALANPGQSAEKVANRYVIQQTLIVRSDQPEKIREASQQIGELLRAGLVLSSGGEYGMGGPAYIFTGLNDLKPQMIAEATARARSAAEQFARDSRSVIGGIRQANQGLFEILPRDEAPGIREESQIQKKVRVVSTIEYFLQD